MKSEIDRQIEIDTLNYLSEDTIFLNENKPQPLDDRKMTPSSFGSSALNKGKQLGKSGMAKIKNLINKTKNVSDEELINGSSDLASSLLRTAAMGGVGFIVGGPLIGAVSTIVGKTIAAKGMHNKRIKLYGTLKSDLAVINMKLNDLEHKGDLTPEERQQKYNLKKLQVTTQTNMTKLANQIRRDSN